jgi:hypothetical protein
VTRSHVLAALREYDELGPREFLRRNGFRRAAAYTLWHQGGEFDPMAVLGVAYHHATGTVARPAERSGSQGAAVKALTDLGFDVVVDEQELVTRRPRPTKATKPKPVAARDTPPTVCPSCHMAVPASGVCDFCE